MPDLRPEDFHDWIRLVQCEYAEMPGLHLSKRQAQRLWNLDQRITEMIFDTLEASHFLKRMPNDIYVRADLGINRAPQDSTVTVSRNG